MNQVYILSPQRLSLDHRQVLGAPSSPQLAATGPHRHHRQIEVMRHPKSKRQQLCPQLPKVACKDHQFFIISR